MSDAHPGSNEPVSILYKYPLILAEKSYWEVLNRFDSEAAARVSGAAETVDYFG